MMVYDNKLFSFNVSFSVTRVVVNVPNRPSLRYLLSIGGERSANFASCRCECYSVHTRQIQFDRNSGSWHVTQWCNRLTDQKTRCLGCEPRLQRRCIFDWLNTRVLYILKCILTATKLQIQCNWNVEMPRCIAGSQFKCFEYSMKDTVEDLINLFVL